MATLLLGAAIHEPERKAAAVTLESGDHGETVVIVTRFLAGFVGLRGTAVHAGAAKMNGWRDGCFCLAGRRYQGVHDENAQKKDDAAGDKKQNNFH